MSVEVNEIDFMALKQLINKRDKLKREETQFYDHESPAKVFRYSKAKKTNRKANF
jgi:hypothetical protein